MMRDSYLRGSPMIYTSKSVTDRRRFLVRVFAINLVWGVSLYLLIGENREANLWINVASFAGMVLLARVGGLLRHNGTGAWLVEGTAWHFGSVQVANLLVMAFGGPHLAEHSTPH
jgi:hypothetical protein